jgi:cytochrome c
MRVIHAAVVMLGVMMGAAQAQETSRSMAQLVAEGYEETHIRRTTTADGETHDFWERNLRFKTDSSEEGPVKGAPAILGAGMMGDRASVIFAAPDEISGFIKHDC